MILVWSKNEEPERPRPRAISRNCGQLLGQLDELLPFLYIAQYGASFTDLHGRRTEAAPGLFAVSQVLNLGTAASRAPSIAPLRSDKSVTAAALPALVAAIPRPGHGIEAGFFAPAGTACPGVAGV